MDIYGDIVLHQNVKAGLDPEQYLHKWSMVNISGMINWYRHGDLWWHNVFFDIDGFYLMGMTDKDRTGMHIMGITVSMFVQTWSVPSGYVKIAIENGHL